MTKQTPGISRSSAAEYLTYVAASGDQQTSVEMRYENENIWLTQKMMAVLYDVDVRTINYHLKSIFADGELVENSVIQDFRITATDGKTYRTKHYNLHATAFDYDRSAPTTRDFFALVQNKLHWAVHRHTAAELIVARADASQPNMGLTHWQDAPHGKIIKTDVSIAKNYLNKDELDYLERIVSLYLDFGELQAQRKIPMSMADWATRLDGFLEFNGNEILTGPGKISHEQAKLHAETEFEKYRVVQDQLYASDFDRFLEEQVASYTVLAEANMGADKELTDLIKETGHAGA